MTDEMRLNSLSPAEGSKRAAKRVGRGIGSGTGKTAGRGHKGLKSPTMMIAEKASDIILQNRR